MAATWSGSWADECDDDLGPAPPPPVTALPADSPETKRSYACAAVESAVIPVIIVRSPAEFIPAPQKSKRKPGIVHEPKVTFAPVDSPVTRRVPIVRIGRVEFAMMSRSKPETRRAAPTPAVVEHKCEKCHMAPGKFKFTDKHVEGQSKSSPERLELGTYCLPCINAVAPKCGKPECNGRAQIRPPDHRYAFHPFCTACIAAFHAAK